MDMQVLAHNVKRLRKANPQLSTQGALAKAAGVPKQVISGIERAQKTPEMEVMAKIATALDVKRVLSLFVRPRELPTACFRKTNPKAEFQKYALQNLLADVAVWLDNFGYLEEALGAKQEFRLKPVMQEFAKKKRDTHDPARAAEKCREILKLKPNQPIVNIFTLLTEAGVKVYPVRVETSNFFGFAVADADGGPAVVVNVSPIIPVERWIFSAAHELGHLILHSATHGNNEDKESPADQFAGYFLMPDALFEQEWKKTSNMHSIDRILKVKRACNVSYKTILRRLIDRGEAYDFIWRGFVSSYKRKFGQVLGHKDEPQPLIADEIFTPDQLEAYNGHFQKLVVQAIDAEKLGSGRGAEMLDIDLYEMRDILYAHPVS